MRVFWSFERFLDYFSNFLGWGIFVILEFLWVFLLFYRFRGILVIFEVFRYFLRFQEHFGHLKSYGGYCGHFGGFRDILVVLRVFWSF